MPVGEIKYEEKKGGDYKTYRSGSYQMQIVDINEYEGKNLKTGAPEMTFQVDAQFVDGNYLGDQYRFWVKQSWFTLNESKKKPEFSPSKLFGLQNAINKFYTPDTDANALKGADVINQANINSLVGKQIFVNLMKKEDGKNKVIGFEEIEKEIAYEPIEKTDSQKVEQINKGVEEFDKLANQVQE
jgi:hypothetical protein